MHIVIIPAFFQTKKRPTLGSFFLDQAKALKRAGHNVTILYCDTYSVKCISEWIRYQEEEKSQIEGIQIFRNACFCPSKHGMQGYKEAFAKGIEKLWQQHLSGQKVDVIHAHCAVWAGYAACRLSQKRNIPYVVTEHATLFQLHREEISAQNDKVIRQIFTKAAKVVCVSKAFADLLKDYRQDIEIIGNVVDFDLFQMLDTDVTKYAEKETNFLSICYMEEEAQLRKKGIDLLIQAWAEVHMQLPYTKLILGGGGKAQQTVQEWIEKYQLADCVSLLGQLTRQQVAEQMKQCDCFVLPSRYETFGVVYVEANACGKPVIAVANGGPDDFVNETNGILIPYQEENMVSLLSKALTDVAKKLPTYQPEKIRAAAEQRFSMEAIASSLETIYTEIVGK